MAESRIKLETAAFLDSPQAQRLSTVPASSLRSIVERYLTCCYTELGKSPHLLDGSEVHGVLGHLLPAHFTRRDPAAVHVHPTLQALYEHLGERHIMSQLYEIRRALEETIGEFEQAVETGEVVHHAQHAPQKPFVHHATKVGRNDPCPCGSGKKFKKCCANLGE